MGFRNHFGGGTATASGLTLMDRLSHENGWTADTRKDYAIGHFFPGDAITPQRAVFIYHPPDHDLAIFSCHCRATFSPEDLTSGHLAVVLNKNSESAFGKWELHVEDGDRVSLRCSCTALVAGLDAQYFKLICEQLLTQVAAVEKRFHGYGLM